jgi:hypothetical protein
MRCPTLKPGRNHPRPDCRRSPTRRRPTAWSTDVLTRLSAARADVAELTVPACPAWTIRQTVAHLAGLAQDIVSLNMENKGAGSWTQAQVDRLDGHGIDELLDLWGQVIDPVTTMLALAPPRIRMPAGLRRSHP